MRKQPIYHTTKFKCETLTLRVGILRVVVGCLAVPLVLAYICPPFFLRKNLPLSQSKYENKKKVSPFKDRFGKVIYENDLCRYWMYDECDETKKGAWIIERVKMYKGNWYLFDVDFDYNNSIDKPALLSEHHYKIEVIE